ncbi:hypothetical protein F2P81_008290 [Scophthalmus maximus]|uniref:Uncharacterized protein n=1 Tax=Scophthalmus maximus TaxID=52904 RepID=A0A6A4T4K3_SCOMX|nr:hypothetical protein F2P81_008290 [Scophthalmus maximus]
MMSGSTLVGGEWREEKYAVRETETEREQATPAMLFAVSIVIIHKVFVFRLSASTSNKIYRLYTLNFGQTFSSYAVSCNVRYTYSLMAVKRVVGNENTRVQSQKLRTR